MFTRPWRRRKKGCGANIRRATITLVKAFVHDTPTSVARPLFRKDGGTIVRGTIKTGDSYARPHQSTHSPIQAAIYSAIPTRTSARTHRSGDNYTNNTRAHAEKKTKPGSEKKIQLFQDETLYTYCPHFIVEHWNMWICETLSIVHISMV